MKRKISKIRSNYTQAVIAKTLGVTQPTVSGWLHLKHKPEGLTRMAMERHFPVLLQEIDNGIAEKEAV